MRFRFRSGSFLAASLLALTSAMTSGARAQSANFLGMTTALPGGYNYPYSTAVDSTGNVYVADTFNNQIVMIPYSVGVYGSPTTIANGFNKPFGVAVDANRNVFVADTNDDAIVEVPYSTNGYGTPFQIGGNYSFNQPQSLTVDAARNVIVADSQNGVVVKIPFSSGTYGTGVAFPPAGGLPSGVTVDSVGDIFLVNTYNELKEIPSAGGSYGSEVLVTNGFNHPNGVAVDSYGNIYVADTQNSVVKLLPFNKGSYGSPVMVGSNLSIPTGVTVDASGNAFIADPGTGTILKVAPSVNFGSAAVAATTPLSQTLYFNANSLTVASTAVALTQGTSGLDFTVASGLNCSSNPLQQSLITCSVSVNFTPKAPGQRVGAVELLDSNSNVLATAYVSGTGVGPAVVFPSNTKVTTLGAGMVGRPQALAIDAAGSLYVSDTQNALVIKFTKSANGFSAPTTIVTGVGLEGLAVDGAGNLFAAAAGSPPMMIPYSHGLYGTPVNVGNASDFQNPEAIAVDTSGNLYIGDNSDNAQLKKVPFVGGKYGAAISLGSAGSHVIFGLTVDPAGNVYASGFQGNSVVSKISYSSGIYGSPVALPGSFPVVEGLALDAAGDVYVSAGNVGMVEEIPYQAGSYGTPVTLYSGPIGLIGVAIDATGNVYVADESSNVIRELPYATPPTLSFATTAVNGSSASQTMNVGNAGNAALTFLIPATGQNPSLSANYTLGNTSTCPLVTPSSSAAGTLATGATCSEVLAYTPTLSGATTGNLVFTDNNFAVANAKQAVVVTGSTVSGLTMDVIGQNIAAGTSSITLEFIVGYGGNTAPTSAATLTVNGSGANVGTVSCAVKSGHNNCTATYDPSTLAPGAYVIVATQPADSHYTSATTGTATLTVLGSTSTMTKPLAPVSLAPSTNTRTPSVGVRNVLSTSGTQTSGAPRVVVAMPSFLMAAPVVAAPDASVDSDTASKDETKEKVEKK